MRVKSYLIKISLLTLLTLIEKKVSIATVSEASFGSLYVSMHLDLTILMHKCLNSYSTCHLKVTMFFFKFKVNLNSKEKNSQHLYALYDSKHNNNRNKFVIINTKLYE